MSLRTNRINRPKARGTINLSPVLARQAKIAASLENTTVKGLLEGAAAPVVIAILKKHGLPTC